MAAVAELNSARRNLNQVLGDKSKKYFHNMKMWYKQKITKEEFDREARGLLGRDSVNFHNEFLLAILTKCQTLGYSPSISESKDVGNSAGHLSYQQKMAPSFEFEATNPLSAAPKFVAKELEDESLLLCSQLNSLPSLDMLHGRMFLTAWECGLDAVSDQSVHILMHALKENLKNILSAVFSQRSGYQLREGCFQHTSTQPHSEGGAWQRPGLERAQQEAALLLAANQANQAPPPSRPPVSVQQLLQALKLHRGVITSHTIYATNVSRCIARQWHPSHAQLQQDSLHRAQSQHRHSAKLRKVALTR